MPEVPVDAPSVETASTSALSPVVREAGHVLRGQPTTDWGRVIGEVVERVLKDPDGVVRLVKRLRGEKGDEIRASKDPLEAQRREFDAAASGTHRVAGEPPPFAQAPPVPVAGPAPSAERSAPSRMRAQAYAGVLAVMGAETVKAKAVQAVKELGEHVGGVTAEALKERVKKALGRLNDEDLDRGKDLLGVLLGASD